MNIDHCGFQVKNLDAAIKFYTEKLLFKLDYRAINEEEQEEYAFLSLGKARLELIQDLLKEYEVPTIKKSIALISALKLMTRSAQQSTQQHIHDKLIQKAKEKLSTTYLTVSEIAYELGFEHLQSFSKLFKAKAQLSPVEFRASFKEPEVLLLVPAFNSLASFKFLINQ